MFAVYIMWYYITSVYILTLMYMVVEATDIVIM